MINYKLGETWVLDNPYICNVFGFATNDCINSDTQLIFINIYINTLQGPHDSNEYQF